MLKFAVVSGTVLLAVGLLGTITLLTVGCSLHRPMPRAHGPKGIHDQRASAISPEAVEASDDSGVPAFERVGGDLQAGAEFVDGEFRSGPCRIPTPLPEGYPAPTPPGGIEVKRYPAVRRAGISGSMSPDWGMN